MKPLIKWQKSKFNLFVFISCVFPSWERCNKASKKSNCPLWSSHHLWAVIISGGSHHLWGSHYLWGSHDLWSSHHLWDSHYLGKFIIFRAVIIFGARFPHQESNLSPLLTQKKGTPHELNPFTPKISVGILLTVSNAVLMMGVWRI